MNIYLAGVGGQGIGLLSEILLRAADHAGLNVIGVDTHGLAQRGGIVISLIKFDENVYSPLIGENQADLVVWISMFATRQVRLGMNQRTLVQQ
jgi:indolepyruvate ferredoxin oxidoreductase beta subunit